MLSFIFLSEKCIRFSDMKIESDLKSKILARMARRAPFGVWTANDFLSLGSRNTIDQALSRMSATGTIRRITRGLYDLPQQNTLTGKPTNPDPRQVIDALARRDPTRMLVDGITAANDLGLTNAVPARIVVHTDARLRPIKLGNQTITFRLTSPAKLYWADHPATHVVQAPQWLRKAARPLGCHQECMSGVCDRRHANARPRATVSVATGKWVTAGLRVELCCFGVGTCRSMSAAVICCCGDCSEFLAGDRDCRPIRQLVGHTAIERDIRSDGQQGCSSQEPNQEQRETCNSPRNVALRICP